MAPTQRAASSSVVRRMTVRAASELAKNLVGRFLPGRRRKALSVVVVAIVVVSLASLGFDTSRGVADVDGSPIERPGEEPSAASSRRRTPVQKLFGVRPLVLLTMSYHATPVYDLMDQLEPLGVKFVEFGINAYGCRYFGSCKQAPPPQGVHYERVHNGVNRDHIRNFMEAYINDPEFSSVDAFLCMYPAATCELFAQFNKTLIILTTGRYEFGRRTVSAWKTWNSVLGRIAANPANVIAANNQFDVEYTRYFTGLVPRLIPSRCGYTRVAYNPTRPGYLLGLRRDNKFRDWFVRQLNAACLASNVTVELYPLRQIYPTYRWSDLTSHRGIVALPSQPSSMAVLEQYRMNIPLFLPSKDLLIDFELSETVMLSETNHHAPGDTLPPHPSQSSIPDPTVRLATSLRHWIQFCDWYATLPHVIIYDSIRDLVVKLSSMTVEQLTEVSRRMAEHNEKVGGQLDATWEEVLLGVSRNSPNRPH